MVQSLTVPSIQNININKVQGLIDWAILFQNMIAHLISQIDDIIWWIIELFDIDAFKNGNDV